LRFELAEGACAHDLAVWVARPDVDVCLYLLVRKRQPTEPYLNVNLWVAPPNFPDDSLDRLGIGFQIELWSLLPLKPACLAYLSRRLEVLVPRLGGVVEAVKLGIQAPVEITKRLRIYRIERACFFAIREYAASAAGSYWREAFAKARLVVQGFQSLDALRGACCVLSQRFFKENDIPSTLRDPFGNGNPEFFGYGLASQFYIEALVPWETTCIGLERL
jgi:hypothetical protein